MISFEEAHGLLSPVLDDSPARQSRENASGKESDDFSTSHRTAWRRKANPNPFYKKKVSDAFKLHIALDRLTAPGPSSALAETSNSSFAFRGGQSRPGLN